MIEFSVSTDVLIMLGLLTVAVLLLFFAVGGTLKDDNVTATAWLFGTLLGASGLLTAVILAVDSGVS